jgi:flagellar L-ring protein precursor FlgH
MKRSFLTASACCVLMAGTAVAQKSSKKDKQKSALDQYVEQAHQRAASAGMDNPGSLYAGASAFGDVAVDLRARSIDDMVTILVNESVNAVSTGTTKTQRSSNANASITGLAGTLPATNPLTNLLNTNSATQLNGQGTTSRQTTLSTTLTARVVDVLPNGYLVIEGSRNVMVNSENQDVKLRGVVRPTDLSTANVVASDSIGQMELQVNGKGVVNDSIKRPNFLYRLLLGLLPF